MSIGLIIVFLSILNFTVNSITPDHNAVASKNEQKTCRCVIFRFDDIRNGYLETPQIALMNFFISNNHSLNLGLVVNQIENDSALLNKLRDGYKKNLFELGIHGWDHVDYTKLSENEQKISLLKANHKMNALFGNYSRIFIPPFNLFNNMTTSAMRSLHFDILSSAIYYDEPDIANLFKNNSYAMDDKIIHMPEMTDFSIYYNGMWVKVPIKFILSDIDFDISTYGYSVVMIHPHNFATEVNGSLADIVDINQLQSLNSIINAMKSKNIKISTFSEVAGLK